jgi:hypothetical protein
MLARDAKKRKQRLTEEVPVGKLHSIESAAEFLGGLSPWTIRRWLSDGKLTRVKVGSRTMCMEAELIAMAQPETPAQAAARNAKHDLEHQAR